jgi:hypothetical protein
MTRGTPAPEVTPAMYKEVFEDGRTGQLVLEHLIQVFTEQAVTSGGIDAVLKTYQRMGQRRVLDFIITQINRAHGVPDPQGEDDARSD